MSLYKVRKAISSAVSAMEFSGQTDPTPPLTYAACSILVFTLRFHTCAFQGSIKPIVFAVRKQVLWFIREPIKLGSLTSYIDYFSQEFARISHHFLYLGMSTRVLVSFSPYLTSYPST